MVSQSGRQRTTAATRGQFPVATVAVVEERTTAISGYSGESCRSCTATIIADCVALCCCPCAVVNFLAFAFLRVPWILGRRCLSMIRRKRSLKSKKKKVQQEVDNCSRKEVNNNKSLKCSKSGSISGTMQQGHSGNPVMSSFEAEKLWLEWYQVGHWGFGRLSFSAAP